MWFLVLAVVASAVGIAVVLVRNKPKASTEASIAEFGRNLDALAPDHETRRGARPKWRQ